MVKNLPVYQLVIGDSTDDLEVDFVALVDTPAIEKNFIAFNNKARLTFNSDRQIISGPAMLADFPIYRRNEQFGEHYVVFTKDQIAQIANKFLAKGYATHFNLFHDPNLPADGVSVLNSFVTDEQMGIMPMKGFEDSKDGSWFISAKVTDPTIWGKVKSGEIQGFSVEGMFKYKEMGQEMSSHDLTKSILQTILDAIPHGLIN